MTNPLTKIVENEVRKLYKSESDFYSNVLKTTQQTWNRWKRGERGFSEEKLTLVSRLFTPYEWMLVNKIDSEMKMYSNNFKDEAAVIYHDTKVAIAKQWVEAGAAISVNSARNVDDPNDGRQTPGTEIKVTMTYDVPLIRKTDDIIFYVNQSSGTIKAGKENRKQWFLKNIKELV